ncbi:toxin-antitoxin system YwqK family antitoxin [Isoptericola croceus]|uniref:toxin-antitoxin system YwqK family antitoxin n=1 Tax=Isoptericola croceus TaxID=3031406 RepID=UPI0023F6D2CC|nr:hypothetical protein [Isoptericola croceus]
MTPTHSGDADSPGLVEHIEFHRDGTVRGTGHLLDGQLHGFWEWFRVDGTRMRSGHFDDGRQVGEWITYDRNGEVYKVTTMLE